MRCEEAAEFVSALCDGEKIPRAAAEHIGACEACRARMKQYAEIGMELRRVASLDSPEEARARTWGKQQRIKSNWWAKGWETMRIPRFAFVLLWAAVAVLGSSIVMVKVRAHTQGPVLMLTAKPAGAGAIRCALSLDDKNRASCALVSPAAHSYAFRIISKDGDRIELGVRAGVAASVATPGGGFATRLSDVGKLPERQYWFEPGKKLEIDVAGLGTMVVTGELLDHMPVFVDRDDEQLTPKADELRVISPVLLRGKEVLGDFEGISAFSDEKNRGIEIYIPGDGRYELSLLPLEGAVEGHVNLSRVSFELNGQSYTFLTGTPVARSEHIWIIHEAT
ncbi:MAG: hypothetical protein WAM69_02040, partial [Candidatus Sulfotelmatobacter sp.]